MTESLKNKTVLVTGASSGLGKQIAIAALNAGANVVGVDINNDRLVACQAELASDADGRFHVAHADITSEESAQKVFNEAVEKFGRVDALVNNAGIMDNFASVADLDMTLFDRVMAVNLRAPAFLSKLATAHFLEKAQAGLSAGNIVNIGSQSSFRGGTGGAAYTASKHAMKGVTLNTAAAYSDKGIRCNMIMPGAMDTNIADCFASGVNMDGLKLTENTRAVGGPTVDVSNVARMVVHLMSDAADGFNGACITADGGWGAF